MNKVPVTVSFQNVDKAAELEAEILMRVADLQAQYGRILGCHVFVDRPHRRPRTRARCRVRVGLAVPGELIVVDRAPLIDGAMKTVVRAFDAIGRRLRTAHGRRPPSRSVSMRTN